jgi:menaquinone-dependent protoporphyrinogen oxidase
MNTLIVYASLHGCTKKCALKLSQHFIGKTTLVNLKVPNSIDLTKYSNVIIGGSIHTGHINPSIKNFFAKNINILLSKNIGLFLCFMDDKKKFEYYLNKSFPEEIIKSSKVCGYFGGELNFYKMTYFEKLYIRKTTNIQKSVSKINENSILDFCNKMNKFIGAN